MENSENLSGLELPVDEDEMFNMLLDAIPNSPPDISTAEIDQILPQPSPGPSHTIPQPLPGPSHAISQPLPGPSQAPSQAADEEVDDFYEVLGITSKVIRKFSAEAITVTAKLKENLDKENPEDYLRKALDKLINEFVIKDLNPRDRVGLVMGTDSVEKPIFISYRAPSQFSADVIMNEFSNVIQSNKSFLSDEPFKIKVTRVRMPNGEGRRRKFDNLPYEPFCKKKTSIITIDNPHDNLCLPRALVVGQALVHKDDGKNAWNHYDLIIKKTRDYQLLCAQKLCRKAKVDINIIGGGIDALTKFQEHLKYYRIVVFDGADTHGRIVSFKGDSTSKVYIFLFYHREHYNVITSLKAAFGFDFFYDLCCVGYHHKGEHKCEYACYQCLKLPKCEVKSFDDMIKCDKCHRDFYDQFCYDNHLQPGHFERNLSVCQGLKYCYKCSKLYSLRSLTQKHDCESHVCSNCNKSVPHDHVCFIKRIKRNTKASNDLFIFFDFEARVEEEPYIVTPKYTARRHIPNYAVLQMNCTKCINNENDDMLVDCDYCGKRHFVIENKEGDALLHDFFTIIREKTPPFMKTYVYAHNGGGYDYMFLIEYMVREIEWIPKLIMNGSKLISMKYNNIEFKDSLNFFHTKLAALPDMFGIEDASKGYFPHFFNTQQNQNYIGPIPEEKYYGVNEMLPKDLKKFQKWYNEEKSKNVVFNFKEEMRKYCIADVEVLRKACVKFRKLFYDLLHLDPLAATSTIAGACMTAYRMNFIPQDTIALMTFPSYRMRDNQSLLAVRYLMYFEDAYGVELQSAYRGWEKQIDKYKVDAYHPAFPMDRLGPVLDGEPNIRPLIIEINGCYYHGCPKCFPNRTATVKSKSAKEYVNMDMRYKNTMKKLQHLQSLVSLPHIISKWECDIYAECAENSSLKQYMTNAQIPTPIYSNREPFFGGRTENFYW
ncbi:uncharacterized protein LOC135847791 [Planococcus citri]|uniref:uncharacterized protein LOC135847791 n=1 Tax=Planococcus citri TaxID=170843 RepID=UPI0031F9D3C0